MEESDRDKPFYERNLYELIEHRTNLRWNVEGFFATIYCALTVHNDIEAGTADKSETPSVLTWYLGRAQSYVDKIKATDLPDIEPVKEMVDHWWQSVCDYITLEKIEAYFAAAKKESKYRRRS